MWTLVDAYAGDENGKEGGELSGSGSDLLDEDEEVL